MTFKNFKSFGRIIKETFRYLAALFIAGMMLVGIFALVLGVIAVFAFALLSIFCSMALVTSVTNPSAIGDFQIFLDWPLYVSVPFSVIGNLLVPVILGAFFLANEAPSPMHTKPL